MQVNSRIKIKLHDLVDNLNGCLFFSYLADCLQGDDTVYEVHENEDDCFLAIDFSDNKYMIQFLKNVNSTRDSVIEEVGVDFTVDVEILDVKQPDDIKDKSIDESINMLQEQIDYLNDQLKIQSEFSQFLGEILEKAGYLKREVHSKDSYNLH